MSLIVIKGSPTITWGTSNTLGAPAGAIVESARFTPKNGSPIEIEDNNGIAANLVLLRDGFNARVACLYDGSKAWPVEGANVALTAAINGASANSYPFRRGQRGRVCERRSDVLLHAHGHRAAVSPQKRGDD